jgi:hypothetical protein
MWETHNYDQVRRNVGFANALFLFLCTVSGYYFVVSAIDRHMIDAALIALTTNTFWAKMAPLAGTAAVAVVWGYLTTALVRLHDRIYEPHLTKWRASYDADFILRGLCFKYSHVISRTALDKAYFDQRLRNKMMNRLFYSIVGDFKADHLNLLVRFYTFIRNYWTMVVAELYCLAFALAAAIYGVMC